MLKLRLWLANRLGRYGRFLLPKNYLYINKWFTVEEIAEAIEGPLRTPVCYDSELKSIFKTTKLDITYSTKDGYTKTVFYNPPNNSIQDENTPEGWYFWDEVGLLGGGVYKTEEDAIEAVNKYAEWLQGPFSGICKSDDVKSPTITYSQKERYKKSVFLLKNNYELNGKIRQDGWYHWTELGLIEGPFSTEEECIKKVDAYWDWLDSSIY